MNALYFGALFVVSLVMISGNGLGQSPAITATISRYAGVGYPVDGTQAITQYIGNTLDVVSDGSGNVFVSTIQNRVYRVDVGGILTVVAGSGAAGFSGDGGPAVSAQLYNPMGLAIDRSGNLFIADYFNHRIRKVTPDGVIRTVAGDGSYGFSGDGGPATLAQLNNPWDVAVDGAGNLFIADFWNFRIRKVTPDGIISTVAGNGTPGFSGDGGPATLARLSGPRSLAVDESGSFFIADGIGDFTPGRVRKVTPDGVIVTVAGSGTYASNDDGGPATFASLVDPSGVAVDGRGNIFVAESAYGSVWKVTPDGVIHTVAGNGTLGFSGDGGAATSAQLNLPRGVAVDGVGNVFISDSSNARVRKVTSGGVIRTVAGNGLETGFSGDGGPATSAKLMYPDGMAVDSSGNLYFADNGRVRKVAPDGIITTVAGTGTTGFSGDGGPATSAQLLAFGVAVDTLGNLFIAEGVRVRKVTPDGIIRTIAGNGRPVVTGDGGPATSAGLWAISLAVDAAGNLFTAGGNVRKITRDGIIDTVAGRDTPGCTGDRTRPINSDDVAVDAAGNLFIADTESECVYKLTPDGVIRTVAGNGTWGFSGDGGPAIAAQLALPMAVTVDAFGNLFIADRDNYRIRKVTPDGVIRTIAGNGRSGFSGDNGEATSAVLLDPEGLTVDRAGSLFIAERNGGRIRKVTFTAQSIFRVSDRGGQSWQSAGTLPAAVVGHAAILTARGDATPAGLAILAFRQNNVLISEASVPASSSIQSGRIYAELSTSVNTGVAIANPNWQPNTVSFFFTDSNGDVRFPFSSRVITIPANGQIARFLNEAPFNAPSSFTGTFTFSSSLPVAVVAMRGLTNERGEFLITTMPVADLSAPVTSGTVVFPQFADGGGWTTQIILVNPSDIPLAGSAQFLDPSGQPNASSAYSIAPRSCQKLSTPGASSSVQSGSVRVIPAQNTPAPSGLAVFSFRIGDTTVAEASVPGMAAGTAFRMYAESSESVLTGLAVANTASIAATVILELNRLDGSSTGLTGTLTIPANGQIALFLNNVQGLAPLQTPFQGIVRLSSPVPIVVVGLRGHYNERGDFLISTTPPFNEATMPSSSTLFFPHIVDSGGYTTQFIMFSSGPGASTGTIQLWNQSGGALGMTFR